MPGAYPLLATLDQAGGLLRILRTLLAAGKQGFQAFVDKALAYLEDAAEQTPRVARIAARAWPA